MSLKMTVRSLEEVAEPFRELYEKTDDGYTLKVDDPSGGKAKLAEFRSTNIKLMQQLKELQELARQFEGIDPKRAREAESLLNRINDEEEKQLIAQGKLDDVIARRTTKMRSDFEAKQNRLAADLKKAQEAEASLRTRHDQLVIDQTISGAVTKRASPRPGAMLDILARARSAFQVDEQGKLVPREGSNAFGKDGQPISLEEWTESLVSDASYLFDPAAGSGASGGRRGDAAGRGRVSASDPVAFGRNLEGIAKGTVDVTP